jgi:hypothetical protein
MKGSPTVARMKMTTPTKKRRRAPEKACATQVVVLHGLLGSGVCCSSQWNDRTKEVKMAFEPGIEGSHHSSIHERPIYIGCMRSHVGMAVQDSRDQEIILEWRGMDPVRGWDLIVRMRLGHNSQMDGAEVLAGWCATL